MFFNYNLTYQIIYKFMKKFLTDSFILIFFPLLMGLGLYGINNPIGITYELRKGTIIAKDSTDIKVGKNAFRKQYRFALKYKDKESDVIAVNLAQYTEKEIGQTVEIMTKYQSGSYYIVLFMSCLLIFMGFIGTLISILRKN